MKTLKTILEEAEQTFEYENPDEDTPYVELTLKAVKEWLSQKRLQFEELGYRNIATKTEIDELLRELEEGCGDAKKCSDWYNCEDYLKDGEYACACCKKKEVSEKQAVSVNKV